MAGEDWTEYRRQVVGELEELNSSMREMRKEFSEMKERMTRLEIDWKERMARLETDWKARTGMLFGIVTLLGVIATFGQWLFPHK